MLYKQYDAMKRRRLRADAPPVLHRQRVAWRGSSSWQPAGSTPASAAAEDVELAYRLDRARAGLGLQLRRHRLPLRRPLLHVLAAQRRDYGVCDALFARDYGRDDVREIVRAGFQCRPAPVRWMTYGCLDRPRVASVLQKAFRGGYVACEAAGADRLARFALSGMYNISYYRGISDELGGRGAFRELVGFDRGARRCPKGPRHRRRSGSVMSGDRTAVRARSRYVWDNGRAVLAARWYLRHADSVGSRVRLRGRPSIQNHGRMVIGSRVQLVSTVATLELVTMEGGTLEIGERTLLNYGGSIAAADRSASAPAASSAPTPSSWTTTSTASSRSAASSGPSRGRSSSSDNVWLGARVIVLGGVTIGDDSCIAAGSVVDRGRPAPLVGRRRAGPSDPEPVT